MVATSSTLPTSFVHAIAGMKWPLGLECTPPLYYEPLGKMKKHRDDEKIPFDFMEDIPGTVESLFPQDNSSPEAIEKRHFGLISTALILLGHGYTDECHDLVTPISWPEDIGFAYGPPVYSNASPAARSFASYVHSLVHRKEAFNVGEFGMMGFQNSNYWSGTVARTPGSEQHLPHNDLFAAVKTIATSDEFANSSAVKDWCNQHDILDPEQKYFDSRAVHELCANVLKQQQKGPSDGVANAEANSLHSFAEQVAGTEMRVLLKHTLPKAGFSNCGEIVM